MFAIIGLGLIFTIPLVALAACVVDHYRLTQRTWRERRNALNNASARLFVERNLSRARELDPNAFPAGSLVVYWPEISDEAQRKALEQAAHERSTAVRI